MDALYCTGPASPPKNPRALGVSSNDIAMAWDIMDSIDGKMTMYEVMYLPSNTAAGKMGTRGRTLRETHFCLTENLVFISDLAPNTSYTLFVRAYNLDGGGPYSKAVEAVTLESEMEENSTDAVIPKDTGSQARTATAPGSTRSTAAAVTTQAAAATLEPTAISSMILRESWNQTNYCVTVINWHRNWCTSHTLNRNTYVESCPDSVGGVTCA